MLQGLMLIDVFCAIGMMMFTDLQYGKDHYEGALIGGYRERVTLWSGGLEADSLPKTGSSQKVRLIYLYTYSWLY